MRADSCLVTTTTYATRSQLGYERALRVFTLASMLVSAPAAGFAQRSVYIEDLTWPEVQQAIAAGKTSAII